jgi:murein endopeptidase
MDFLEPEKTDERRGDGRKRRGSDHQVARPRFHLKIRLRCTSSSLDCTGKTNRTKGSWLAAPRLAALLDRAKGRGPPFNQALLRALQRKTRISEETCAEIIERG